MIVSFILQRRKLSLRGVKNNRSGKYQMAIKWWVQHLNPCYEICDLKLYIMPLLIFFLSKMGKEYD